MSRDTVLRLKRSAIIPPGSERKREGSWAVPATAVTMNGESVISRTSQPRAMKRRKNEMMDMREATQKRVNFLEWKARKGPPLESVEATDRVSPIDYHPRQKSKLIPGETSCLAAVQYIALPMGEQESH